MSDTYTMPTMNISPGIKVLKRVIKDRLESVFRNYDAFKDLQVLSEHTDTKTSNNAVYISVKSRTKESTGIDNYGGTEKSLSMLTAIASVDVPGTSIEWASTDIRKYDFEEYPGSYFITVSESTFSYLHVKPKSDLLAERHDGVTTEFYLSESPIDPSTVRIIVNSISLIRGVDFEVDGNKITLIKFIPAMLSITANYQIHGNLVENIAYEKGKYVEMLPGVTLYFSEHTYIGDELALFLYGEPRKAYHVFSSRNDMSASLLFSLGDKKLEDELLDFIYTRVDLELRNYFQNCGWVLKDLSTSEDGREDWDAGSYYSVSASTINFTVNMEWARFVPMVKEFAGFHISATGYEVSYEDGIGV